MEKIVVTGAAGFIGSHVVDSLLSKGYMVVGIDNFSTGSRGNLANALKNENFELEKLDILNEKAFEKAAKNAKAIIHLAAFKIPLKEMKAEKTLIVNSHGTEVVLNVARKNDSKVVFASTSDVYGKSMDFPFREDGNLVLGPSTVSRWSYAASKIFDEHLCIAYRQSYGLNVSILRYFNSYGPRHDITYISGGPHALFIEAILEKKPITIYGDGSQKRCFCYVSDTVNGTILALESNKSNGEIFNIGNDSTEISVLELAKMAMELCGKPETKIEFKSHETLSKNYQEVQRRIPDISKAKGLLGFKPVVENRDGMIKTVEWQSRFYKAIK